MSADVKPAARAGAAGDTAQVEDNTAKIATDKRELQQSKRRGQIAPPAWPTPNGHDAAMLLNVCLRAGISRRRA